MRKSWKINLFLSVSAFVEFLTLSRGLIAKCLPQKLILAKNLKRAIGESYFAILWLSKVSSIEEFAGFATYLYFDVCCCHVLFFTTVSLLCFRNKASWLESDLNSFVKEFNLSPSKLWDIHLLFCDVLWCVNTKLRVSFTMLT